MGATPKVGHHNVGMQIDGDTLMTLAAQARTTGTDLHLESCTIRTSDFMMLSDNQNVTFNNCTFQGDFIIYGPATVIGGTSGGHMEVGSGVHIDGLTVSAYGSLGVFDAATAHHITAHVGASLRADKGATITNPRWEAQGNERHNSRPATITMIPGATVKLAQPGWAVRYQVPQALEGLQAQRSRVLLDGPAHPPVDMIYARAVAAVGEGPDSDLFIAGDNLSAWTMYREMVNNDEALADFHPDLARTAIAILRN